jgi:O-antigen ligase
MTSDARDRAVNIWLASSLVILPLLPAGPTYLGLDWPWALDAFFLLTAAFGLIFVARERSRPKLSSAAGLVCRGYAIWLLAAGAATAIGLLERTPLDSAIMRVEADGLFGRLGWPMDQAADPLYPARVGLTCLEGGVMFWLLSVLLRRTDRPERRARAALHGCLLGMSLVSLIALVQYVTRANLHEYWVRANPELTRAHATLDDPNSLASFLVLGFGLTIGAVWSGVGGNRRRARRIIMVIAALAGAALITTVSRAGWAALVIAAVGSAALIPPRLVAGWPFGERIRRIARAISVAGAAALVVWVMAFVALPKRQVGSVPRSPWEALVQTVDPRESLETLLKRRHLLWSAGAQMVAANPVAGAGLGQFPRLLGAHPGTDGPENAHNYILQVLAETGVVGLGALIVLLASIAVALRDSVRSAGIEGARFGVGLATGLYAFVLTWLTGHPLLNLSHQLWFASVLAVGLAVLAPPAGRPAPRLQARFLRPVWISGMVIVILAGAVPRALEAARNQDEYASHAAGVYAWETGPSDETAPPGARFRWTRARAALREPIRGPVVSVPIYLARPDLPERHVTLSVTVNGREVPPVSLTRNGWQALTYDLRTVLGEPNWRAQAAITLLLTVSPPVVPAEVGESSDARELGIGLGELQWPSEGSR